MSVQLEGPLCAFVLYRVRTVEQPCARRACTRYFGGLAWAILVARVCQLYPSALPATALQMFFKVWAVWPFPSRQWLPWCDYFHCFSKL